MPSTELMKLAPTLSAEERFKMVVANFHKRAAGEPAILSESERHALMQCETRPMWEEYTRHISTIQWASVFWVKDIETEKLRVLAAHLIQCRELDKLISTAMMKPPKSILVTRLVELKDDTAFLERNSVSFFAYREAIIQIERDHLYGVPLFDEKKIAMIASYYDAVDDMIEGYNRRLVAIAETKLMKGIMKPVMDDIESYRIKKPVPPQEVIDAIIAEVMGVVDSEMEMLGR